MFKRDIENRKIEPKTHNFSLTKGYSDTEFYLAEHDVSMNKRDS